jgi:hypothetical protein
MIFFSMAFDLKHNFNLKSSSCYPAISPNGLYDDIKILFIINFQAPDTPRVSKNCVETLASLQIMLNMNLNLVNSSFHLLRDDIS